MNSEIRLESQNRCIVCGEVGNTTYRGLTDRQFGVSGEWSMSSCTDSNCGTYWLNPKPVDSDIHKTYINYYTHGSETRGSDSKRSITAKRITRLFESLIGRLIGIKTTKANLELMYANKIKPGKILEAGCGSGFRLSKLRSIGWNAIGQDVDAKAVDFARSNGEEVVLGELDQADLPSDNFDAIVSNHVFEHVSNPLEFLRSCYRLIKPGGHLVLITPNPSSLGHQKWGKDWYCLDPPRHLFLFSPDGIKALAMKAGFQSINAYSSSAKANWIANGSIGIREYGKPWEQDSWWKQVRALAFLYKSWLTPKAHSTKGEETVLRAIKPE